MHYQGCNSSLNVLATAENSQRMYCLSADDVAEGSHGQHHADEWPIAMVLRGLTRLRQGQWTIIGRQKAMGE
eukprot:scaffold5916_cov44-Cyclotella_meneghiniana.AAC.13